MNHNHDSSHGNSGSNKPPAKDPHSSPPLSESGHSTSSSETYVTAPEGHGKHLPELPTSEPEKSPAPPANLNSHGNSNKPQAANLKSRHGDSMVPYLKKIDAEERFDQNLLASVQSVRSKNRDKALPKIPADSQGSGGATTSGKN